MKKLESPLILPPESLCQNWVSNDNFDLNENLTFSFKIKSNNTPDKEIAFGIFLTNSSETDCFGATTIRAGALDYSTKGEIGEGININGGKYTPIYQNNEVDLLLDHVYPYKSTSLCKNQRPFNVLGINSSNKVSILFSSTKNIFKEYQDSYRNVYFDEIIVKDIISEEIVDPLLYESPIFLQIKDNMYVLDFKVGDNVYNIASLDNIVLRFSFENYGKLIKIDIFETGANFYKPLLSKYVDLTLNTIKNLKLGYLIASPLESYDISKQGTLKIENFQIQGKLLNFN